MTLTIAHQDRLSRSALLIRTFLGIFYIYIPHLIVLVFVSMWSVILSIISFWVILLTGIYPKSFFDFQVGLIRWRVRLMASMLNMTDEYPAFGIDATSAHVIVDIPYPESLSRVQLVMKALFGCVYVLIPHGIILGCLQTAVVFVFIIGWWAVLLTGRMPQSLHHFMEGEMRWSTRVLIYMGNMTDKYPPFSLA